jgi:hypothetical protein
MAGGPGSW